MTSNIQNPAFTDEDKAREAPVKPPAPAREEAVRTCPMHREISQTGPGNCPICGRALESSDR
jgi:hypothetical protein